MKPSFECGATLNRGKFALVQTAGVVLHPQHPRLDALLFASFIVRILDIWIFQVKMKKKLFIMIEWGIGAVIMISPFVRYFFVRRLVRVIETFL